MKYKLSNGNLTFKCPGCGHVHTIPVDGSRGWKFDEKTLTLTPSLNETWGHYVDKQPQPPNCYLCNDAAERGVKSFCGRCHIVLTKGIINFCADSTHALAGKAVPMIEMEAE